jgi:hypothetical protein
MCQCNAQTSRTLPGVVSDGSTARLSRTCTTTKEEPPSHPTLRGLDLLKSCAKFYENDVRGVTPTVRLSHSLDAALNQPAIAQVSRSRHSKRSIITVAVTCLFLLLLLPSLGVATIVWGGFVSEPAQEPGLTVGNSSAAAAQLPAPAITALLDLKSAAPTQTPSNDQSDIIIHKVKTQPITVDAEEGPDPDRQ